MSQNTLFLDKSDWNMKDPAILFAQSTLNELAIFAHDAVLDKSKSTLVNNPKILFLREINYIFDETLSELINCSNATFKAVQSVIECGAKDYRLELLKLSVQYRSIIRTCLDTLQERLKNSVIVENTKKYQNFIKLFYTIECVWHLCEIFYVDVVPGNIILPKFQQWIRFHFPKFEKNAYTFLQMDFEEIESDNLEEYWSTIIGSLLQGRIDLARGLINMHSNRSSVSFQLADEVLKTMPIYQTFSDSSISEFHLRWKNWSLDCQSKIAARAFCSEPNLELIMRLVVGEDDAFAQASEHCETWYEILAAWLFFNQQMIKYYEMGQSARRLLHKCKNSLKRLDYLILAVIEGDVFTLISEISQMSENGWFSAHILDLLYHSGFLKNVDTQNEIISSELRDNLIVEYGTLLMNHDSLWQVGISYFDHVTNKKEANARIESLLSRLPLKSEKRISKILYEAKQRKLYNLANSVSKIWSMKLLKRNQIGSALMWALRSQDSLLVSVISDKILHNYITTGQIECCDLLSNLGSAMLSSGKLVFLAKYCEFQQFRTDRKFREAASILLSLVGSKITPNFFWRNLFEDICSLLEPTKRLFSSTDIYTVLSYLEAYTDDLHMSIEDKKSIHVALSCYLSEILVYEASKK